MDMAKEYDLVIIGAGPGGYTAALKAADYGIRTLVIEEKKLGGNCVNRGCIPTKALLHASSRFREMQQCDEFGVSADFISFDFKKMQQYKKRAVKTYRDEIERLFCNAGVDYVEGKAVLRRDKTVEVRSLEGRDYYRGENIIIATGASAEILPIPGAELSGVFTSSRLLAADIWNFDRLTIIGGGVIGVEFATIFNALCSKVTIIEKGPHLLGPMDEVVAKALEKALTDRGITVYCNAQVSRIEEKDGLCCLIETKDGEAFSMKAGQILMAAGRKPNIEGLFGSDISLEMNQGKIAVNSEFMTSEQGIYAVGDVISGIQLAHVAAAEATYVVEKIAGKPHSFKLEVVPAGMYVSLPIVPNCIYTQPEIATVGITEETARASGMKVRCGRYSMMENGKSIIAREEEGFIRLIFEAYSDTIVGAQIVCPRATDMIGEMATAIANGLTASQLSMAMRAHPTYSEGISAAIADAMRQK